MAVKLMYS